MAGKISLMDPAGPLLGAELFEVVQGGVNKRVASSDLGGGFSTATKTLYVSAAGDDENDGLTSATPFATWAKLHSALPDVIRHAYVIRVVGNLPEAIYIEGKRAVYGRDDWRITVIGDSENAANHQVSAIYASGADHVSFNYLQPNGEAKVQQSNGVRFHFCQFRNAGAQGVRYNYSTGAVQNCDFGASVNEDGIFAFNSMVWSDNNTGACTRYGLLAHGGYIGKYRAQPTGGVENNLQSQGGSIVGSHGARITSAAGWTQSIPDNTFTDVDFLSTGVAVFDEDGWWSSAAPSKLIVPANAGGLYVLSGGCRWAGSPTTGRERYLSIRAGNAGATVEVASDQLYPAVNETNVMTVSTGPVRLSPGQEIMLRVRQKTGAALNLTYADQSAPVLSAHRVG
ncbi:hypothetical protein [Pseudomonas sp.]|uniref:hypothetical protein n=1 Tax=Pseudomonas sp. TaxID=306 RepID=UPI002736C2C9|nr:hypothetical protein [Pseudomonas sp.]MDP3813682.1 hypothetical protein [Pseudomonas sp.]